MSYTPTVIIFYVLWLAPAFLQLGIAGFMVRHRLLRQFPYFFAYTIFEIFNTAILFIIYHWLKQAYFTTFWASSIFSIVLGFAVLHEVFAYALRPYAGLRDLGMMLFRWALLLLLLVSAVVAGSSTTNQFESVTKTVLNLEIGIRLMQCGLLMFMFMCSSSLGLSWQTPAFGIALGFGIFAATDLAVAMLRSQVGVRAQNIFLMVRAASYNIAAVVWFAYLIKQAMRPERTKVVFQPVFDRWNQAAMLVLNTEAQTPVPEHSYLSDLERTVADVMASTGGRASPPNNLARVAAQPRR